MKHTPIQQQYLDAQKRSRTAKALNEREKPVNDAMDVFYSGKASLKDDADRREINSYMEMK